MGGSQDTQERSARWRSRSRHVRHEGPRRPSRRELREMREMHEAPEARDVGEVREAREAAGTAGPESPARAVTASPVRSAPSPEPRAGWDAGPAVGPVAGPVAEAAVAAVRRSSLAPLRARVGATRLRLAWVLAVGAATVALLGVGPPREAGGLMVAAVAMLLVIRPVLLICLGDPTLFDPDSVDTPPSPADNHR